MEEDIIFNFDWQNHPMPLVDDPDPRIRFDPETISELRANPIYKQLLDLHNDPAHEQSGFRKWESVYVFIMFAFERLTMYDIKDDLEITFSKLNVIDSKTGNPWDMAYYDADEMYDGEINKLLGRLRMINLKKRFNIKAAIK